MPSGSPGKAPCGGHAQRHEYSQAVIVKLLRFIHNCTTFCRIRIHARKLARTQIHSQSDERAQIHPRSVSLRTQIN
eukprot:56797-Pyramimonas_sp.AAC.1